MAYVKTHELTKHPLIDALLDELRDKYPDTVRVNDALLARELHIQKPMISKVRNGMAVSDGLRVRVMRTFNWPLKRLDKLAPPAAPSEQV